MTRTSKLSIDRATRLFACVALAFSAGQMASGQEMTEATEHPGTRYNADSARVAVVATPEGEMNVRYREENGHAIAWGDVVLGRVDQMVHPTRLSEFRREREADDMTPYVLTVPQLGSKWPNGVVTYRIDQPIKNRQDLVALRNNIKFAVAYWNANTELTFVDEQDAPYTPDVLSFRWNGSSCVCGKAAVGYQGGFQDIWLGSNARVYEVNHEIAHTIGLHHEQQRPDRGDHIVVNYLCIASKCWPAGGESCGFDVVSGFTWGKDYDFDSVTHYDGLPSPGFGRDCYTMYRRFARPPVKYKLGRVGKLDLSPLDLQFINWWYSIGSFPGNP